MWARIDGTRVVEVTDIDPQGRFHPSLRWESADKTVDVGDLYDGQTYSKLLEPLADIADRKRSDIESGRKAAEQNGVTVNNIRYAGDPSNRQALREALDLAEETGLTAFPSWKDSDGEFRIDLAVTDIHQALMAIAARRSQLIAREGELNAQINAALEAEDREALAAIEWSEPVTG